MNFKKNIKILIVEDDYSAALELEMILDKLGYNQIQIANTEQKALDEIDVFLPDFGIIDIYLNGEKTGIKVAEKLKLKQIPFIYTTAYNTEFTFNEAKKTLPYAFFEKPFDIHKIEKTIDLALLHAAKNDLDLRKKMDLEDFYFFEDEIFVKTGYQLFKVPISSILYVKSEGNYCTFKTSTRKHAMKISLKKIEAQFPSHDFIRIHQRYLVQKHNIQKIDLSENQVILENDNLPIGRKYKKELLRRLKML